MHCSCPAFFPSASMPKETMQYSCPAFFPSASMPKDTMHYSCPAFFPSASMPKETHSVWMPQELMNKKDLVGDLFNQLRVRRQRSTVRQPDHPTREDAELEDTLGQMLMVLDQLDSLIGMQ